MIKYQLTCPKAHEFEGWFASSKAFDAQVKKKLVACPSCGSTKVAKALMAPNVVTSERKAEAAAAPAAEVTAEAPAATPQIAPTAEQRALLKKLKKLRDEVIAKSDYVGPRFAEEARRIHNGDADVKRGVYGEATSAEVRSLVEDGIDVMPLPVLPDDKN